MTAKITEMQTVYHYTSLETLFKLLDGIKDDNFIFYATRISAMNDTSELLFGFRELIIVKTKCTIFKNQSVQFVPHIFCV